MVGADALSSVECNLRAFSGIYIVIKPLRYSFPRGSVGARLFCAWFRVRAPTRARNLHALRGQERVERYRWLDGDGSAATPIAADCAVARRGARQATSVLVELKLAPTVPDWSHSLGRTGSHPRDQGPGACFAGKCSGRAFSRSRDPGAAATPRLCLRNSAPERWLLCREARRPSATGEGGAAPV